MVRRDFVKRKIHLISEDLGKLLPFKDSTFDEIIGDVVKIAAVERFLERIVMRAIDINEHLISELSTGKEERSTRLAYRDTFLKLVEFKILPKDFAEKIALSTGLRNILVHDYNDTDHRIVYSSIKQCLQDYQIYIDHVLRFLDKPNK
ncbi:DUF86 domain-containing protein [Elusimicrobiota bacterium]